MRPRMLDVVREVAEEFQLPVGDLRDMSNRLHEVVEARHAAWKKLSEHYAAATIARWWPCSYYAVKIALRGGRAGFPASPERVHFVPFGWFEAACKHTGASRLTTDPAEVTCLDCKKVVDKSLSL